MKDAASASGRQRRSTSAHVTHSNLSCSFPSKVISVPQGTSRTKTAQSISSVTTGTGEASSPVSSRSSRAAHAATSSPGLRDPVGGVQAHSPSQEGP